MNLGVSLLLVRPGELPTTDITGERLLPGVSPDVRGEVVAPAEGPHADPALEGLLARVDADVAGQLVGTGEPPFALGHGTRVRPLVDGGLARPVGVLAGANRDEADRQLALLVDLGKDLVSLARARVVVGQGGGVGAAAAAARLLLLFRAARCRRRHRGRRR